MTQGFVNKSRQPKSSCARWKRNQ